MLLKTLIIYLIISLLAISLQYLLKYLDKKFYDTTYVLATKTVIMICGLVPLLHIYTIICCFKDLKNYLFIIKNYK